MKLRQVALVAQQLAPVRAKLFELLGLTDDFADKGVAAFGLENSVMAIGNSFLEVVSPTKENTTAGRLLQRRGGDGGYMVIMQVDDITQTRARIEALEVRIIWQADLDDAKAFHMHPRDVGAAITSFDQMLPPDSWRWAGPGWQQRRAKLVDSLCGVELQCVNPESVAQRWAEVTATPLQREDEAYLLPLEDTQIRFVGAVDDRGDGVSAIDVTTSQWSQVRARARQLALPVNKHSVDICGVRFNFIEV